MPAPQRPLALVTGASAGIGLELARQFAGHGFDLVVVADEDAIEDVAIELRRATGVEVMAVKADLAEAAAVEALHGRVQETGRPLAAAALNAGIGTGGAFATDIALDDDLRVIDVNVRSTVHLAKRVAGPMVQAGEGKILITSSIAAALPGTYQATYNASKAFLQSFAMALRTELAETGVTVTALLPGPTDTEFFRRNAMDDTRLAAGPKDDPADVARDGFRALMNGDERVVTSSLLTKVQHLGASLLPDRVTAALQRLMSAPASAGRRLRSR
jgi:uncharacterized protein